MRAVTCFLFSLGEICQSEDHAVKSNFLALTQNMLEIFSKFRLSILHGFEGTV